MFSLEIDNNYNVLKIYAKVDEAHYVLIYKVNLNLKDSLFKHIGTDDANLTN